MTDDRSAPIPMRLPCPECGELHIDEPPWDQRIHTSHACQRCGMTWRPAVMSTVGVRFLPGFQNEPEPTPLGTTVLRSVPGWPWRNPNHPDWRMDLRFVSRGRWVFVFERTNPLMGARWYVDAQWVENDRDSAYVDAWRAFADVGVVVERFLVKLSAKPPEPGHHSDALYSQKQGHRWVLDKARPDMARCLDCDEMWPIDGDLAPMPECPGPADKPPEPGRCERCKGWGMSWPDCRTCPVCRGVMRHRISPARAEAFLSQTLRDRVDLRASQEEIREWREAADDGERTLSQWIRYELNRAAKRRKR